MRSMGFRSPATRAKTEIRGATHIRKDLVLLTLSLLVVGCLIFTEWQRQVNAFRLSIQEYAESLEAK